MMSKHPQPESSNFFLFARTLAYHTLPVGTRALASLSCPKRLSGGPNKRQTSQRQSKNLGHRSGRGAIALNSNDKVEFQLSTVAEAMPALQHRQTPTCSLPSTKPRFRVLFLSSMMMQTSAYCRHQKAFANDENKNDRRAFRKPQLPSELRKSDFEVEGQRLTSANEKTLFRQRARVLGRESFQTLSSDCSVLDVAWGLWCRSFIRRHHPILFFASRCATTTIFIDLDGCISRN
jgi:hypothetical protein